MARAIVGESELCPGAASECVVTRKITITDPEGVDVGSRALRIQSGGRLIASESPVIPLTIKAGSIVVEAGGGIFGNVQAANANGLSLIADAVTILGTVQASAVRTNGTGGNGGSISVLASGPCQVAGKIVASGSASASIGGSGGEISIDCSTIDLNARALVEASASGPGGAGGRVSLASHGGAVNLAAGSTLRTYGSASAGGSISVSTDANDIDDPCNLGGKIVADAKTVVVTGGVGGRLDISCGGDVSIFEGALISLTGATGGGTVSINSGRDVYMSSGASIRANGKAASGGTVDVVAGNDVTVGGRIETRAGREADNAGSISIANDRDLTIAGGATLNVSAARKHRQAGRIILHGAGPDAQVSIEQGASLKAQGYSAQLGAPDIDVAGGVCAVGGKIQADANGKDAAAIGFVCDSVALSASSVIESTTIAARGGSLSIDTTGALSGEPGECILDGQIKLKGTTLVLPKSALIEPDAIVPLMHLLPYVPGYGGSISAACGLGLSMSDRAEIDVSSWGRASVGGTVALSAAQPIDIRGRINARSGGLSSVGGSIALAAPAVSLEAAPGSVTVSAETGGTIDIAATDTTAAGSVTVERRLDASGEIAGGSIAIRGCDVRIGSAGGLRANGDTNSGGINQIQAQNALEMTGAMIAKNGENLLVVSPGMSPMLTGTFDPFPQSEASLTPCP
jgi:hypothetical protein